MKSKTISCELGLNHPSGVDAARLSIKIAARVLAFIKDYRATGLRRVDFITLLAGIYSPPSGDAIGVIGRINYPGYTRCERLGQQFIGSSGRSLSYGIRYLG